MAKSSRTKPGSESDSAIAAAIDRLTEEVRVLRQTVDELREEVQWGVRNALDPPQERLPARRITSLPLDPCAEDFAERVNALTPEDLPPEVRQATSQPSIRVDAQQFEHALDKLATEKGQPKPNVGETITATAEQIERAMEGVEQLMYCCAQPNLQWYGEPEAPGISCANCNHLVAHEGDILCWRGDEETAEVSDETQTSAKPESQQRELF